MHVDKGEIYPKLNRIIDILDCWSYQFWTWNFLMCISLIYSSANCTKKYVHCKVIFANLLVILFFKPQQQTLKIQLVYWFWQLSCNCLPGFTTVIYSYQSHSVSGIKKVSLEVADELMSILYTKPLVLFCTFFLFSQFLSIVCDLCRYIEFEDTKQV